MTTNTLLVSLSYPHRVRMRSARIESNRTHIYGLIFGVARWWWWVMQSDRNWCAASANCPRLVIELYMLSDQYVLDALRRWFACICGVEFVKYVNLLKILFFFHYVFIYLRVLKHLCYKIEALNFHISVHISTGLPSIFNAAWKSTTHYDIQIEAPNIL